MVPTESLHDMFNDPSSDPGLPPPFAPSDEQKRVDAIVAEAKVGVHRAPPPAAANAEAELDPRQIDARVSEELEYVRRLLDMMGDQFASDPMILQRHGRVMQGFDLAGQILGHIAKLLLAEDRRSAVERIGMHELRARLKRPSL